MHRLLVILLAVSAAFAQAPRDIRILSEDNRSLTLEFTPKIWTQTVKSADGTALSRIAFAGEIIDQNKAGAPWISYRGLPLQFPTSRASVTIVSAESHTVEGMRPLPVPRMVPDPKFGLTPVFQSAVAGPLPVYRTAQIVDVSPSSGRFIGTLKLYPIAYDLSSGNATVYTKIVVRVAFDGWPDNSMRTSGPVAGVGRSSAAPVAPRSAKKIAADSPLAQGTWYKMEVRQTGIFKIDQAFLQQAAYRCQPSGISTPSGYSATAAGCFRKTSTSRGRTG